MAKSFFVVISSATGKAIPRDEIVSPSTVNGTGRYSTYDEAVKVAADHAQHDHTASFVVMKAMTVFGTEPKIVRKSFS